MSMQPAEPIVSLPPGVTIVASRETSQVGPNGVMQQGIAFTLRLANDVQTSIFVPYTSLRNAAAVAAVFNSRINEINSVYGLQSPAS